MLAVITIACISTVKQTDTEHFFFLKGGGGGGLKYWVILIFEKDGEGKYG